MMHVGPPLDGAIPNGSFSRGWIHSVYAFPTGSFGHFDRPLTPNLGGVVTFNAFVGQGQSQFEAPVKRPRPKEDEVKLSGAVLGRGQAVKAPIWAVKDLDPGRKRINYTSVYWCHPLDFADKELSS